MRKAKSSRQERALPIFFYCKLYDEDQHDETEMESDKNETENDSKETNEIPEITKAKQQTAMESEPKTLKHATKKQRNREAK